MVVEGDGGAVSAAERVGVGVRGACGDGDAVLVGGFGRPGACELRWLRESVGRQAHCSCGFIFCERVRTARCARERTGVGGGLLAPELRGGAWGWSGVDGWRGLRSPGVAGRLVGHRTAGPAFRDIATGFTAGIPWQLRRFPSCQDVGLSLGSWHPCLLWGPGGVSPLVDFFVRWVLGRLVALGVAEAGPGLGQRASPGVDVARHDGGAARRSHPHRPGPEGDASARNLADSDPGAANRRNWPVGGWRERTMTRRSDGPFRRITSRRRCHRLMRRPILSVACLIRTVLPFQSGRPAPDRWPNLHGMLSGSVVGKRTRRV